MVREYVINNYIHYKGMGHSIWMRSIGLAIVGGHLKIPSILLGIDIGLLNIILKGMS